MEHQISHTTIHLKTLGGWEKTLWRGRNYKFDGVYDGKNFVLVSEYVEPSPAAGEESYYAKRSFYHEVEQKPLVKDYV